MDTLRHYSPPRNYIPNIKNRSISEGQIKFIQPLLYKKINNTITVNLTDDKPEIGLFIIYKDKNHLIINITDELICIELTNILYLKLFNNEINYYTKKNLMNYTKSIINIKFNENFILTNKINK